MSQTYHQRAAEPSPSSSEDSQMPNHKAVRKQLSNMHRPDYARKAVADYLVTFFELVCHGVPHFLNPSYNLALGLSSTILNYFHFLHSSQPAHRANEALMTMRTTYCQRGQAIMRGNVLPATMPPQIATAKSHRKKLVSTKNLKSYPCLRP